MTSIPVFTIYIGMNMTVESLCYVDIYVCVCRNIESVSLKCPNKQKYLYILDIFCSVPWYVSYDADGVDRNIFLNSAVDIYITVGLPLTWIIRDIRLQSTTALF